MNHRFAALTFDTVRTVFDTSEESTFQVIARPHSLILINAATYSGVVCSVPERPRHCICCTQQLTSTSDEGLCIACVLSTKHAAAHHNYQLTDPLSHHHVQRIRKQGYRMHIQGIARSKFDSAEPNADRISTHEVEDS